jgi:hypothetical protein
MNGAPRESFLSTVTAENAMRRLLWVILIGVGVRVALAFNTYGFEFDMDSLVLLREQLDRDVWGAYGGLNVPLDLQSFDTQYRWPYPPGFMPWAAFSGAAADIGFAYDGVIQLPAIAADAALAIICFDFLRRRGRSPQEYFLGGALIAIAPPLLITSGYHGQIDSLAFLPAALAVWLWDRDDVWEGRGELARPLAVGALIGLGGSIKFVPLILLAAFFPFVARRPKQALALIVPAVGIPLLMFVPFLLADTEGVRRAVGYSGSPGASGLSMLLQPGIVEYRLGDALGSVTFNDTSAFFYDHGGQIALLALAATSALLLVKRPEPVLGALLLIVTMYVFATNNYLHYVVWCMPFLVMAGYTRIAALIAAWMLIPSWIAYWAAEPDLAPVYIVAMTALYVGWIALGVMLLRRIRSPGTLAPSADSPGFRAAPSPSAPAAP